MTNILEAVSNIVGHKKFTIRDFYSGRNRANNMGNALESYIKDAFADAFHINNESSRLEVYNNKFSWLGSQNNPPDIMIRGGDAIEVKKTQSSSGSRLALNSSYPKANLIHTNPMITKECRSCEDWITKDLIYCVGHTSDIKLKSLWMVYGSIYAAKQETYERIKRTITEGIKEIQDVVFSDTKELSRINQVDPLGITNLRVRGMWDIENPRKVFSYLQVPTYNDFELICLIPKEKYNSFPETSREKMAQIKDNNFTLEDRKVKDPNNPANLLDCKLIRFYI